MLLVLLFVLVPTSAHAGLKLAGGKAHRERKQRETPPRTGINLGGNVRMGAAGMGGSFVPVIRGDHEVGGGITDRFTLGVAIGGTAYLALSKGSFNADVVARRFFGKGFHLRGALGVSSHVPALASVPMSPAVGGQLGLGHEFRVLQRLGLGLGVDYDLRLRTDGRVAQTWLLGLRFTGYFDKRR